MGTLRRGRDELVELVDLRARAEPADRLRPAESGARPVVFGTRPKPAADGGDFEAFYRRELPGLVVLARVLAGPAVAEDVAQEAMLLACRKWDTVQTYESPGGWVRTVCIRKAVSVTRRRSVERRVLRQLGSFRAEAPSVVGEDERFWRAVRALPHRQAQVVALHYALDLPVAEVAATLVCAEGTVKAHLSRARAALATTLGVREEEPT